MSVSEIPAATQERLLPAKLRDRSSFVLARLGLLAGRACAAHLAEAGVNPHQHAILLCLDEFGPAAQKSVATRLGIDGGDTVGLVDGLQERGLVVRRRDERDRRRQILTITTAGRRALRRIQRLLDDAEAELLDGLPDHERAALHALAVRVLSAHQPEHWPSSRDDPDRP